MTSSMCSDQVATWCNYIAGVTAVAAGIAWYVATRHPVAVPGLPVYMPADREHPLWKEIAAHGRKIVRGGKWNLAAAVTTCVSALAIVSAWFLPRLLCS
jgi:hypothetical protein